jgi:phage-related baseplate assembly protein
MSNISTIDLSSLPPPGVIEELDFEVILRAMRDDLVARFPAIEPVIDLESEPARKLLEVCAYRELLLRQRVNDAARANLLAFSGTTDLDHLASFYGVTRLTDETDTALRLRVQQRIQGWSNAGGAAHYRYWALTSDERVSDAAVSSPSAGIVRIAVLSAEGDGGASDELLASVRATVLRDDIRVLTDTVDVVSASIVPVDVTATVYLYPDTPAEVIEQLRADFPVRFAAARGLGWDLTRSWVSAQLHPSGVQRVELASPSGDTIIDDEQCVALGATEIIFGGRDR